MFFFKIRSLQNNKLYYIRFKFKNPLTVKKKKLRKLLVTTSNSTLENNLTSFHYTFLLSIFLIIHLVLVAVFLYPYTIPQKCETVLIKKIMKKSGPYENELPNNRKRNNRITCNILYIENVINEQLIRALSGV